MTRRVLGIVNAIGKGRGIEMYRLIPDVRGELPNRTQIIEYPERTPMRRENQIIVLHDQVVNWNARQVQLQRPPLSSAIKRHEHPVLRAGVQQAALLGILTHRSHKISVSDTFRPAGPCLAV